MGSMQVSIRPGPQVHPVAGSPFFSPRQGLDSELDDVQVEAIGLAGAELVRGVVRVTVAQVPLSRGIYIAAEGSGRDPGHDRARCLFLSFGRACEADDPYSRQAYCPFVKLHSFLRCCSGYLALFPI